MMAIVLYFMWRGIKMKRTFKLLAVTFAILTIYTNIRNSQKAADYLFKAFFEYDE